jgi:hypothetical protein
MIHSIQSEYFVFLQSKHVFDNVFISVFIQDGESALMRAADEGHVNIVGLLLAREGVDINLQDEVTIMTIQK